MMKIVDEHSTEVLLEAQAHVWNYALNYLTSMSLRCAVQLGIPDIISHHGKPAILSVLAKALSIPQSKCNHLYRLMRILVHSGFFTLGNNPEHQDEGYLLTPSSELLVKDHVTSLSPLLLMVTDPLMLNSSQSITELIQGSSTTPFEAANGMTIWNYCALHPEFSTCFNDAMVSHSKLLMNLVVKNFKTVFEGSKSLVDVGGGTGTAAKALSETFPNLKCTVYDLPHVVSNFGGNDNIEFVAGDMFECIPSADIIFLKNVLHDWTDEECLQILKQSRKAISWKDQSGKVILIEMVLDHGKMKFEWTESQLCSDMIMMTAVTGKERTETEWKKLFEEAGFKSYNITPALGLWSIIEAYT